MEKFLNSLGPASLSLFGIFICLKVTEYIDWDWFWIGSPLWISFFCGFGAIYYFLKNKERNKNGI